MEPKFFRNPAAFRRWLEKHHASAKEILVGFHKVGSGKPSLTWPESVDEALAYGWIDGVRRRIDAESYSIRFTPRKKGSHWSRVNVARVAALREAARMTPAGEAAFAARDETKTGLASYEQPPAALDAGQERAFRANETAWTNFRKMAPSDQRTAVAWVTRAKKPETRERRLAQLIDASARDEPVGPLSYGRARKSS